MIYATEELHLNSAAEIWYTFQLCTVVMFIATVVGIAVLLMFKGDWGTEAPIEEDVAPEHRSAA